jgi:hypothetical protein
MGHAAGDGESDALPGERVRRGDGDLAGGVSGAAGPEPTPAKPGWGAQRHSACGFAGIKQFSPKVYLFSSRSTRA